MIEMFKQSKYLPAELICCILSFVRCSFILRCILIVVFHYFMWILLYPIETLHSPTKMPLQHSSSLHCKTIIISICGKYMVRYLVVVSKGWTRPWGGSVLPEASPGKGAAGSYASASASLLSVPFHLLPHGLLSSFCHPPFQWIHTCRLHQECRCNSLLVINRWDTKSQPFCVSIWRGANGFSTRVGHCCYKR